MASPSELRTGQVVVLDKELWIVLNKNHTKPGKGPAYYQIKLKHLERGNVQQIRFNSNDNVEVAFLDKKQTEYLYFDGDNYVFMDQETYEQYEIPAELIGDAVGPSGTFLVA